MRNSKKRIKKYSGYGSKSRVSEFLQAAWPIGVFVSLIWLWDLASALDMVSVNSLSFVFK